MKKLWKNHKFMVLSVSLAVILAGILTAAFRQMRNRAEFRSSVEAGNRYLSELDYERAIASYRQALDIDPKNVEANLQLAKAYDANQMYAYSEAVYKGMLEERNVPSEVWKSLAELYLRQGMLEEAKELLAEAVSKSDDEEIRKLYEMSTPRPPAASQAQGAYTRRIKVELIPSEADHRIYYTLDGTEPDENSMLYEEAIIPRNGVTVVKAAAVNSLGYQSDTVMFEYDMQIPSVIVNVKEPVIERIIRTRLNIPYSEPIYNDDIEQVTQIYIVGNGVWTAENEYSVFMEETQYSVNGYYYPVYARGEVAVLDDLRLMPFLERAAVEYQTGLDISALADCPEITELSLAGNGLDDEDMQVIGGMIRLAKLNLGWNDIHDISALSGLQNLESLGIWGNQISSIQPLGALLQLAYLDFSDNQVRDVSALSGLSALRELWMYHNQVEDISPVADLKQLQVLMVRDNPLKNPEAVRSIYPHLTRLDVDLLNLGGNSSD